MRKIFFILLIMILPSLLIGCAEELSPEVEKDNYLDYLTKDVFPQVALQTQLFTEECGDESTPNYVEVAEYYESLIKPYEVALNKVQNLKNLNPYILEINDLLIISIKGKLDWCYLIKQSSVEDVEELLSQDLSYVDYIDAYIKWLDRLGFDYSINETPEVFKYFMFETESVYKAEPVDEVVLNDARVIVIGINAYNALNSDSRITTQTSFEEVKSKLKDSGLWSADISNEQESWEMIKIDEEGLANTDY